MQADFKALGMDWNPAPLPDDQNLLTAIEHAEALMNPACESRANSTMQYAPYLPMSDEWMAVARKAVEGNRAALKTLRAARALPHATWPTLKVEQAASPFTPVRRLASLLGDAAVYAHLNRDDAEAVERLLDVLHLADATDDSHTLLSHLVATGIRALVMNRTQMIAPGLQIDSPAAGASTQPVAHPATREQVLSLLLAVRKNASMQGCTRAFQDERAFVFQNISAQSGWQLLKPLEELQAVRQSRVLSALSACAQLPTYSGMVSAAHATTWNNAANSVVQSYYVRSMLTEFDSQARISVESEFTAITLAAQLYRLDHQGAWPATLDTLVPDYLPAVPLDLYDPAGAKLRYLLTNRGARPVVFSVGANGKSDTPDESVLPATPCYEWTNSLDQWRDLSRFDPPPAPKNSIDVTAPDGF